MVSTLKRTVKAVLRPFVRPVLVRIEELGRRIEAGGRRRSAETTPVDVTSRTCLNA